MELLNGIRYVTSAEAVAQLGPDVKLQMIHDWVHRGILTPVGRIRGRELLFEWEDVVRAEHKTRTEPRGRPRSATPHPCLQKVTAQGTISGQMLAVDPAQNRDGDLRVGTVKPPPDRSVVYYLRFADRVKIGFSRNLPHRLTAIPHDELLALEPGDRQLEQMRHRQFADHRIYANQEWFREHADLLSHIDMLLRHFGPPAL